VTAFLIELTPEEAYYWNYAMHPRSSYFDQSTDGCLVIGPVIFCSASVN